MSEGLDKILEGKRLALMWCFAILNDMSVMSDDDVKAVQARCNSAKSFEELKQIYLDVLVNGSTEIKERKITDGDGEDRPLHECFNMLKIKNGEIVPEFSFPLYCFSLTNFFFNDVVNHNCSTVGKWSRLFDPFKLPETFNSGLARAYWNGGTSKIMKTIALRSCQIKFEDVEKYKSLVEKFGLLKKQIEKYEDDSLYQKITRDDTNEHDMKQKATHSISCSCTCSDVYRYIRIPLMLVCGGGFFVMLMILFPDKFSFLHFPHLVGKAFLKCMIPIGVIAGSLFIYLSAHFICTTLFYNTLQKKLEETHSSFGRFAYKALGISTANKYQIEPITDVAKKQIASE